MREERSPTRRERRIEARKIQILDAAARVFAEKGFHAATTKEIAEAADVAEGTIYNYFESKEDLLLGIMSRLAESQSLALFTQSELLEQTLEMPSHDFLALIFRLRHSFVVEDNHLAMLRAVLSEILVNRKFAERYYKELIQPMISLWEQYLQTRIEREEVRSVNVSLVVRFLLAFNLGMVGFYALGDPLICREWQSDTMIETIVDLFLMGLKNEVR
ncbi:MAG: TetR/AcrR family transcriptional regulator [Anaerolineales bacterium]|nr:TetR/AcrR family transcriptional regulator [Anaerolineales bacterium]